MYHSPGSFETLEWLGMNNMIDSYLILGNFLQVSFCLLNEIIWYLLNNTYNKILSQDKIPQGNVNSTCGEQMRKKLSFNVSCIWFEWTNCYINTLTTIVSHHMEISQLICWANQLTGFYKMSNTDT